MIKFDERDLKQALMIPKNVTLSKEQYMSRIRELAMKGRDYLRPCPVCILGQVELDYLSFESEKPTAVFECQRCGVMHTVEIDKDSVNKQDCIDAWNSKGTL